MDDINENSPSRKSPPRSSGDFSERKAGPAENAPQPVEGAPMSATSTGEPAPQQTPGGDTDQWDRDWLPSALALAKRGIPVFPCSADKHTSGIKAGERKKVPLTPNGHKDATTDEATIRAWWAEHPTALIGVPMGPASGLVAVDADIDRETGQGLGEDTLEPLGITVAAHPHVCATPRGGAHFIYRHDAALDDLPGGGKLHGQSRLPGVDVRGTGGFIVAWHPKVLAAAKDDPSLAPVPANFIVAVLRQREERLSDVANATRRVAKHAPGSLSGERSYDEGRKLLWAIPPTSSHEIRVQALMAFHAWTGGSAEAEDEAVVWATSPGSDYLRPEKVRRAWRHFRTGGGINPATLAALARDHGGADLAAIRREARAAQREARAPQHRANGAQGQREDTPRTRANGHDHHRQEADTSPGDLEPFADEEPGIEPQRRELDEPPPHTATGSASTWPIAGAAGEERKLPTLETFSAASLAGKPVPVREWLVPDMIPHRNVTLLYGDGGTNKSTLALQLAVCCARPGLQWIGRDVFPATTLYFGAEEEKDEFHRRLDAMARHYGVPLDDLGRVHIAALAGEDAALAAEDGRTGSLALMPMFDALLLKIEELKPKLLVIDTLADAYDADENVRRLARRFVTRLRKLCLERDMTILMIAHPSLSGITTGRGTSGSTAWSNSVRSRLYLDKQRPTKEDETPDENARILRGFKNNYGPTAGTIPLYWSEGVLVPVSDETVREAREAKGKRAETYFLDKLAAYNATGRWVSPNRSSTYAPKVFSEMEGCPFTMDELSDAMERLFTSGEIKTETTGPPSRPRDRIVLRLPAIHQPESEDPEVDEGGWNEE